MSIHSLRTLAQLKQECDKLGLQPVQKSKKIGKTEYILALRDYYLGIKSIINDTRAMRLYMNYDSPMLCYRYAELKDEEKQNIWESPNWVLEPKLDGVRFVTVKLGEGKPHYFSRNSSVDDFLPVEYTDNVVDDGVRWTKVKDDFILDAEFISTQARVDTTWGTQGVITETPLQAVSSLLAMESERSVKIQRQMAKEFAKPLLKMVYFDCLWFNGEDLTSQPYYVRKRFMNKAVTQLIEAGQVCSVTKIVQRDKKAYYEQILSDGGEGVVAKEINSPYIATNSRSRRGWVKIKRSMTQTVRNVGLSDSIDAFVSGYELGDEERGWAGYVGSLEFSVLLRSQDGSIRPHVIARISSLPMEDRIKMTDKTDPDNPKLAADYYGRCASLDGQDISARSLRLTHAVLKEWRPDRSPDTCRMDEEFLKSMIF